MLITIAWGCGSHPHAIVILCVKSNQGKLEVAAAAELAVDLSLGFSKNDGLATVGYG